MAVNNDRQENWAQDIALSVELYNHWFVTYAPETYRVTRETATISVEHALLATDYLNNIRPETLRDEPRLLPILRMCTAPPLARDRLTGLSGASENLIDSMEHSTNPRIPNRMTAADVMVQLEAVSQVIEQLADTDLFPWLSTGDRPTDQQQFRAATIVADRLCGSQADPIIRNAQEKVMLDKLGTWLTGRGYQQAPAGSRMTDLMPGQFGFRLAVSGQLPDGKVVNIPIDALIVPRRSAPGTMPLLIEAKSAGDFVNTNKRRKEEANKVVNLRRAFGDDIRFVLYLRGYFGHPYLSFSAGEGIDWFWEHRIHDLASFGV